MIRKSLFLLVLLAPSLGRAVETPQATATPAVGQARATACALPPMHFYSSVAQDELYQTLKADPVFCSLDKELVGSPLMLVVTNSVRPTAGGQAAGFLTAVLSGSTLGLFPIVSSERMVLRYDFMLNGRLISSYSFERKATRATSLWSADAVGLDKASLEWVKTTAAEVAAKAGHDPALKSVQDEIGIYFPESTTVESR